MCIGASNIGLVVLEKEPGSNIKIIRAETIPHEGNPRNTISGMVDDLLLRSVDGIAVTGRKLKSKINASSISEPEAVEHACRHLQKHCRGVDVIVSAGGETFMAYKLDREGRIINVFTGNKCASGTGEFFLQQIKRMDLSAAEAVAVADLDNPYKVAGRCSVFCKSDCTHALNKGAPKGQVTAGLCEMMTKKVMELLKKTDYKKVMLVGGASANTAMIHFLRQELSDLHIPEQAKYFEALGAALWALDCETKPVKALGELFRQGESSFSFLPALKDFLPKVAFKEAVRGEARDGDTCIVGLDVGSTTTKAVVMRTGDNAILSSCYLRTNGAPIQASRQCYREISRRLKAPVKITGLGVTGSGRQIAGLHALTPAVINEIIAHAAAAVYFDPRVDTIFEIGGQDAKYTYITNGVASDYAMNEACSAGTGSFIEEAARESLDIVTEDIGDIALKSDHPLNFSDQCAAFISSDIKSAIQEGAEIEDLAAGLVYSICMNYINRVKGSRAVGRKVFMQGGVCYNRAVPVAMAGLTGKDIIVPPEPGLMGAFGVALEVKSKLELGLLEPVSFDLEELAAREVSCGDPFTCAGGREKCDRKCTINRIKIKEKTYPFGGACNRYVNLLRDKKQDTDMFDLVNIREKLVFEKYGKERGNRLLPPNHKTVAINNALLTNTLFPLYYNFFTALGFDVLLSEEIDPVGMERRGAEFCFPVEIAHGALMGLIRKDADIYFLPHISSLPVENEIEASVTCPMVQAEPYYLKAAFDELKDKVVLSPVLSFSTGYDDELENFITIAKKLGVQPKYAREAFTLAVQAQKDFHAECRKIGKAFLAELEKNPEETAVVLFGRTYNAFTKKANMGIPQKFATRGHRVVPYDFLPCGAEESGENMYWSVGKMILKGAHFVKRHPQLYPTYITNFSCGPDSFLVGYIRNILGQKPLLTLELDSHTADAGLDTRIEAFLDVVRSYIEINKHIQAEKTEPFRAAKVVNEANKTWVVDSSGNRYPLNHPGVHVLIPSMGDYGTKLLAATLRRVGINATAGPAPSQKELKTGKEYASCKECLPLILTVGSLMDYLENRNGKKELLVYFMPKTSGPCRFGQYNVFIKHLIEKMRYNDVTMISLTSENSYAGFGTRISLRAWQSIIVADVMDDIYSAVLTLSADKQKALDTYHKVCEKILNSVEKDAWDGIKKTLREAAQTLNTIEIAQELEQTPKVSLIGEIYVRRDSFSRQHLVERLAGEGIVVRTSPVSEWMYYCDYNVKKKYYATSVGRRIKTNILHAFKRSYERTIKEILSRSGFYEAHMVDVGRMIQNVDDLISPELTGEAILTTAAAIAEVVDEVAGIISLGPFGCMPCRIAESIISAKMNERKMEGARNQKLVVEVMRHYPSLPFLAVETDGNPFPQVIEAKLEVFCLQVKGVHSRIEEVKRSMS